MRWCIPITALSVMALCVTGCKEEKSSPHKMTTEAEFRPDEIASSAIKKLGWVIVQSDRVFINDEAGVDTLLALPIMPAWRLTCGVAGVGLVLSYGPGLNDTTTLKLADYPLDEQQCVRVIVPVMSSAKARFTNKP